MEPTNDWLKATQSRCVRFAEAYRIQLDRLWWANLCFVVFPAVFSTAAAVFAAIPEEKLSLNAWFLPPASILAGVAAILVAVHKALKCEEYQTECHRLSQRYQALSEAALAALSRPEEADAPLRIAQEMESLTKSARARLPTGVLKRAEEQFEDPKSFWLPRSAAAMATSEPARG